MQSIYRHYLASIFATALLLAASSAAVAQSGASDDDKHFVDAALKGGMAEIELGQLAVKKGNSEDVKQFGQRMIEDHTRLGNKMKTVAGEIGVKPPEMTTAGDMALKAELEVLSGDAFDKAYISAMVKDHEEALRDFRKEAADGTFPKVKIAAREGETVIGHHLAEIRKIAQAHNVQVSVNRRWSGLRGE